VLRLTGIISFLQVAGSGLQHFALAQKLRACAQKSSGKAEKCFVAT